MATLRPVATIIYPTGNVTDTLSPIIEWTYSDGNGYLQASYRIYIIEDVPSGVVAKDAVLYRFDTGLINGTDTFYILKATLKVGISYRLTLSVVNTNGIDSIAAQSVFTIVSGTVNPVLKINDSTLTTDSLTPHLTWEFGSPTDASENGYSILYKDGDALLYESGKVGTVVQYHDLPVGILNDAVIQEIGGIKTYTVILTAYSSDNAQVTVRNTLTIKRLPPSISKFLINQKSIVDDPIHVSNDYITVELDVANSVSMVIMESTTSMEPTDYDILNWVPYQPLYAYQVLSTSYSNVIYIWGLFKSSNGMIVKQSRRIYLDSISQLLPYVVDRFPKDGDLGVPPGTSVRVTFNKLMDTDSLSKAFTLTNYSTSKIISGSFSFSEANNASILVFTPDKILDFHISYVVRIGSYSDVVDSVIVTKYPKDRYDNILSDISWSFEVEVSSDLTPPTDASVIINNGSVFTTNEIVTLSLYADGTPILMNITGDIAVKSTGWIPYTTSYSLKVSDTNGLKTITVFYKDSAGNVSTSVSDSILFQDIIPPKVPLLYPFSASTVYLPSIDVSGSLEPGVTAWLYRKDYDNSHYGEAVADGTGKVVFKNVYLSADNNTFYAKSIDINNNISGSSNEVSVIYVPPVRTKPKLIKMVTLDNTHVQLYFNADMEPVKAAYFLNYNIEGLNVSAVQVIGPIVEDAISYWSVILTTGSQQDSFYTLRVIDLTDVFGNGMDPKYDSGTFLGFSLPDSVKPIVVSATATTNLVVEITFSKPLVNVEPEPAAGQSYIGYAALNSANYSISGLQVLGVEATDDPKIYRVLTSDQSDRIYDIYVSNVRDKNGNIIDLANNTVKFQGLSLARAGMFAPIRATALVGNRVRIEFSAELDFTTALEPTNYKIMGLDVLGVTKIDASTVELLTSRQVRVIYGITLINIKSANTN